MAFHPERFGKYYLVDKLAVGGMAEIFKAKQFGEGGFEKLLVIKRILSHLSDEQDFIEMFFDEAKISSTLAHSNIIHVYDFGKIRSNYFIAMEYCEGKDLKTVMKKCQEIGRPLPVEYAVYIIHEVCKGLDYAHRKKDADNNDMNILHRDISPSNVMISYEEGKVKLADFGIAKAQNASYKTKAGVLKGKFEYMSPEQASGLQIDRRSDIFAVGICFYEILTRRRLFKTDADLKTLELIRNPLIPPPSHLNPQVREELDGIVMKALARRAEDRYQEAWQLQHDLREFMRSSTPPTSPDLIALSLANFMREIFDREIRQERERLEIGTRAVKEMVHIHPERNDDEGFEENWEIPSGNSRVTSMTPPLGGTAVRLMIEDKERASSLRPMMLGAGGVALLVGGALLMRSFGGPSAAPGTTEVAPAPGSQDVGAGARSADKAVATLTLNARPVGANIYVNGILIGNAPLKYTQMTANEVVTLRVEQSGYETYERKLLAQTDGTIDLNLELRPLKSATARSAPRPAPSTPRQAEPTAQAPSNAGPAVSSGRLEFLSSPGGARVTIGGKDFCMTPCAMENGRSEAFYEIEVSMEGYQPYRSRARFPSQGASQISAALQKQESGFLTLTLKDGLSAEIFINGQAKGFAPFWEKLPLSAGRHTIRLRNQVAGLEKTFTVDITPGQETRRLAVDLKD